MLHSERYFLMSTGYPAPSCAPIYCSPLSSPCIFWSWVQSPSWVRYFCSRLHIPIIDLIYLLPWSVKARLPSVSQLLSGCSIGYLVHVLKKIQIYSNLYPGCCPLLKLCKQIFNMFPTATDTSASYLVCCMILQNHPAPNNSIYLNSGNSFWFLESQNLVENKLEANWRSLLTISSTLYNVHRWV